MKEGEEQGERQQKQKKGGNIKAKETAESTT